MVEPDIICLNLTEFKLFFITVIRIGASICLCFIYVFCSKTWARQWSHRVFLEKVRSGCYHATFVLINLAFVHEKYIARNSVLVFFRNYVCPRTSATRQIYLPCLLWNLDLLWTLESHGGIISICFSSYLEQI